MTLSDEAVILGLMNQVRACRVAAAALLVISLGGCSESKANNLPGCGGPPPASNTSPAPCDPNKPPIK